jgi:hypothetical protein
MLTQQAAAGDGRTSDSHSGGTSSGISTQNPAAGQAGVSTHPAADALWCEQQPQQFTGPALPTVASAATTGSQAMLSTHAALLRQLASSLQHVAAPAAPPAAQLEAVSSAASQSVRLPATSAVPATWDPAVQQPQQRVAGRHAGLAASTGHPGIAALTAGAGWPLQPQQQARPAAQAPAGFVEQSALLQALLQAQQQPLERKLKPPPAPLLVLALELQQAAAPQQVAQARPSLPAWQQLLLQLEQQQHRHDQPEPWPLAPSANCPLPWQVMHHLPPPAAPQAQQQQQQQAAQQQQQQARQQSGQLLVQVLQSLLPAFPLPPQREQQQPPLQQPQQQQPPPPPPQ